MAKDRVALAFPLMAVTVPGALGAAAGVTEFDIVGGLDSPIALIATTANVYAIPFVSPATSIVVVPADSVIIRELEETRPPGLDVTVYPVIAEPLPDGVPKDRVALAFPPVAVTDEGADGVVAGIIAALAVEALDVPALFVAVTVNV